MSMDVLYLCGLQETAGCALCGCLMSADSAAQCMWFPKPPLSALALPCPHYMTSSYVCEPCKTANDVAGLKKVRSAALFLRIVAMPYLPSNGLIDHSTNPMIRVLFSRT